LPWYANDNLAAEHARLCIRFVGVTTQTGFPEIFCWKDRRICCECDLLKRLTSQNFAMLEEPEVPAAHAKEFKSCLQQVISTPRSWGEPTRLLPMER
jgi:hypothetical protein